MTNYALQNNYLNICRTCLIENSNMRSIFSIEKVMEQEIMLCDMLMSCGSILVVQGDGLPENICVNCFQQASTAYVFRKLCERSDVTLRACSAFTSLTSDPINIFNSAINEDKFEFNIIEESSIEVEKENQVKSRNEGDILIEDSNNIAQLGDDVNGSDRNGSESEDESSDEPENENISLASNKKSYSCKECNELYLGLASFRAHMAKIHGDIFHCEHCGKQFKSKNFLARHISSSHINTSNPKRRNKTGIIKKRNLPRTCDICDKTFRFHSNLERHKLIHTGEKPYLCNVCGRGFAQMAYLKIHSFIHTGEKPYKCQMCERSFAAPGTLMTHIRTHTGERPHICKICGKDFPQSGYLSAHIRTHTGEKPVECKVCNRRFNQSGRLIVHMRIHSGEKPYQCKECGRSFAVKGTLKKHMRTHTGERPYLCKVCGQAFAQSGTLATHMKIHKPKGDLTGQ